MSDNWGLRHLFGAPHQSAGKQAGGYRTLAASKGLEARDVRKIEDLVSGYNTPQGEGPPCRQLFKFPGRPAYALSTITPNDLMPDGRTGNFLAETIVVPETWLRAADWDVAAAFDAIDWSDPRAASIEVGVGAAAEVEPARLPRLEAGPLDRLGALARDVPAPLLVPLVRAVVAQCYGLGNINIVGSGEGQSGQQWQALERVVLLAPLLVPPALRLVRDEDGKRLLYLRSRSPHDRMAPRAEITGFLPLHAEGLEQERGEILDLGGGEPPARQPRSQGERYAHWLAELIREGRFDELEARYREPVDGRPEAWFATVPQATTSAGQQVSSIGTRERSTPPAGADVARDADGDATLLLDPPHVEPAEAEQQPEDELLGPLDEGVFEDPPRAPRDGSEPTDLVPTPVIERREAIWEARDDYEARMWQMLDAHREHLQTTFDELHTSLAASAEEAREKLQEYVQTETSSLHDEVDGLKKGRSKRQESLTALSKRLQSIEKQLGGRAAGGGGKRSTARRTAVAEEAEEKPPTETLPADDAPRDGVGRQVTAAWGQAVSKLGAYAGWLALVVLIAAAGVVVWYMRSSIPTTPPVETVQEDGSSDAEAAARAGRQGRRDRLIETLASRRVANVGLRTAIQSEEFRDRAESVAWLATLGYQALSTEAQVLLMQQAIGVGVDGEWGPGSRRALRNRLDACAACLSAAPLASELAVTAQAAVCFQNVELKIAETASCDLPSPWERGRVWTLEQAQVAQAWISETRTALGANPLVQRLPAIDPQTALAPAAFRSEAALRPEHAEAVLHLLYAFRLRNPEVNAPEQMTDEQLRDLESFLSTFTGGG